MFVQSIIAGSPCYIKEIVCSTNIDILSIITVVSNPTLLLHAQSNNNGNQEPIKIMLLVATQLSSIHRARKRDI